MAGVTVNGFDIKGLPELIEEFQAAYRETWGAETEVEAESLNGQKIAIVSDRIADLWELGQQIFDNAFFSSAVGVHLERIGVLFGIPRLIDESDVAYRNRIQLSIRSSGRSAEALRAGILRVAGVTEAVIVENPSPATSAFGQPPHSFRAIVAGGDNDDIGLSIWQNKPDGIQPFGATTVVVDDSDGNPHTVAFDRPTAVPVYIQYTYSLKPNTLETDVLAALTARVAAVPTYRIGQHVYPYEFEFSGIPGIVNLDAQLSRNGLDWTTNTLEMDPNERAGFNTDPSRLMFVRE